MSTARFAMQKTSVIPDGHWANNIFLWLAPEDSESMDWGILHSAPGKLDAAHASINRAFRTLIGQNIGSHIDVTENAFDTEFFYSDSSAMLVHMMPSMISGVLLFPIFENNKIVNTSNILFSINTYLGYKKNPGSVTFSAKIIGMNNIACGDDQINVHLDAMEFLDGIFSALAKDQLWQWDQDQSVPIRRTPPVSQQDTKRYESEIICGPGNWRRVMLDVIVPQSLIGEEEHKFLDRIHRLTVGRVAVFAMHAEPSGEDSSSDDKGTRNAFALTGFRVDSKGDEIVSMQSSIAIDPAIDDELLRNAILYLRTKLLDKNCPAFPIGPMALSYFNTLNQRNSLFHSSEAEKKEIAEQYKQEIQNKEHIIEGLRTDIETLRLEISEARIARDKFRDMVRNMRATENQLSRDNEAMLIGGTNDDNISAAAPDVTDTTHFKGVSDAPADLENPSRKTSQIDNVIGSSNAIIDSAVNADLLDSSYKDVQIALPADWRSMEVLERWCLERYGERLVFHPRVRGIIADTPNTIDTTALADILDIIGKEYIPMIDGDSDARNRYLHRVRKYKIGNGISENSLGVVRGYEFLYDGKKINPRKIRKIRERGRSMSGRTACVYYTPLEDHRVLIVSMPRHMETLDS